MFYHYSLSFRLNSMHCCRKLDTRMAALKAMAGHNGIQLGLVSNIDGDFSYMHTKFSIFITFCTILVPQIWWTIYCLKCFCCKQLFYSVNVHCCHYLSHHMITNVIHYLQSMFKVTKE